jgi:hypothetical protein
LTPQPKPAKLAKSFTRKHDIVPALYHVVTIEPMKAVLRSAGGVPDLGQKKATHIVRGHFRDYTPERPLFGKVVGRIFIPAHDRGNKNLGVKKPGYKVKRPPRKV